MRSAADGCLFEREHHRRVARVLEALDADVLAANRCYFGGGTAIALKYGEYRESNDVDFLVSDVAGYRALRQRLNGREGLASIAKAGAALVQAREVRADQYGIRTMVDVDGVHVKFEIVLEARIELDAPPASSERERVCGVVTLTTIDMATSKLLANSDRWADDAVHSRDVIDLAMMRLDRDTLAAATTKARAAYGAGIERDLGKAIEALRRRRGRLAECMRALQMTTAPRGVRLVSQAELWREIRRLAPKSPSRRAAKAPKRRSRG
jgi:hypothetical protein